MREIKLSKGYIAVVDEDDYEWLIKHKWCSSSGHKTVYAVRGEATGVKYKRKIVMMHRQILGTAPFAGAQVDHINGNGLDNRRTNLRWVTHKQNRRNEPKRRIKCTSSYKGVALVSGCKNPKWRAQIKVDGVQKFLGHFNEEIEAARAYNAAAMEYYGEFANLNSL